MWVDLFLYLVLAHLISDFVLQTNAICENKADKKWRSPYQYVHLVVVFALSWLVSFDWGFVWCAGIIGISHFAIDMWKAHRPQSVIWFAVDQFLHLLILAAVALVWCSNNDWCIPFGISGRYIAVAVATLVCWKPANIFIKLMLKHFSVNMPEDKANGINAGALIGTIERWLILIFVFFAKQIFFWSQISATSTCNDKSDKNNSA